MTWFPVSDSARLRASPVTLWRSTVSLPRVSVVIPVWNGERYLGEALRSVRVQTYRSFEIVVIDDGSIAGGAGGPMGARAGLVSLPSVRQSVCCWPSVSPGSSPACSTA